MKHTSLLVNPQQAYAVWSSVWSSTVKPMTTAGHRLVLTVESEKRTSEQNKKFHAICRDYARSGVKFAGRQRTEGQWKVLLISGHAAATGDGAEVVAGLEGEFVNVRESSAEMSKQRGSSLIEYCIATAVRMDVPLTEYESIK